MLTRARRSQIEKYVNNVNNVNDDDKTSVLSRIKLLMDLYSYQQKYNDDSLDTLFNLFMYSMLLIENHPSSTQNYKSVMVSKLEELLSENNKYTNVVIGDFTFGEFLQTCLYRLK